ncbi:L,D-transpeptidase family protein [Methylobacterium sp. NEAU 140]|uniref:L,D-transpeptidase family protein n=1 Tax=Methylobacterium sp. NEAU 140 TaxID=3064945 RepID=UPI0027342BFF|nr:L,D-transpeptidase family protein [Methylobacterium sp. NEAU 140]MDP4022738.1 L,D-transpeptidase family protein [Methylobacterium sp. NEAU 140]
MVPPHPVPPRPRARLRAGLCLPALLAGLGGALAQGAPAPTQQAAPAAGPVPAAAAAPATPAAPVPQPATPPAAEAAAPSVKPADTPPKKREPAPLVYAKVSADPLPTLTPRTFLDTLAAAERYAAFAEAGGWERTPDALASLKPGERSPAIPALRHHLTLVGDLPANAAPSDRLDPPLVAAIAAFQARHGLPDSGILGRLTLNALNVPAETRQRQLAASAARLMGSKFPFGERYVTVNIPSATVEAVEGGQVVRRYVAVVGSPDKATPAIETRITDINFNPTWTVPVSVVKNEIIPQMRKNPGYLAKNRIRILGPGGIEVDPTKVDWATEKAVNYTLRQDSGLDNSLGQVRIDMPNRYAVYMHDTPAKSLFARSVRFHSHGCVRVGQVKEFVGWLLQGVEGPNGPGSAWGPMEVETGIADGERRDIKLAKPVPVRFVYLTGYGGPDGRAHFRDDIYGLDSPAPATTAPAPAAAAARPADPPVTGATGPKAAAKKAAEPAAAPRRTLESLQPAR